MRAILEKVKQGLFPVITLKVRTEVDKNNIKNISIISSIVLCMEAIRLICWFALGILGGENRARTLSVISCIALCAVMLVVSCLIRKSDKYNHRLVSALSVGYFILMITWACFMSRYDYIASEQMFTFYSVIVCFVCFVAFRPIVSCLLIAASYGALYIVLWYVDGAKSINVYNLIILALLSLAGLGVRYSQQIKASAKNFKILYHSHHDELTGLRNRAAFEGDIDLFLNQPITVIMADIDYFKQINDDYGHLVGDQVLHEVSRYIKHHFPSCTAYRFGGDEFLIVIRNANTAALEAAGAQYEGFTIPVCDGRFVTKLSFGVAGGVVKDYDEYMALISEADKKLYRLKKQIHKDDVVL